MYYPSNIIKVPNQSSTAPPIKIKIQPNTENKKQIVQSDDPETKEKPTKKTFLGDKDRKFERESIPRKTDPFKSTNKTISLSDIGAFEKGYNSFKEAEKNARLGSKPADYQTPKISSTNDYVENVPLGDLTYLNTVEYKYYGFYHRIRQELEQFWGRSIQEKASALFKEGSTSASDEDFITALEVTLNEKGEIVEISIKTTSGFKELDDAAVESFNKAGPFPHPPKGLVENGLVKISWGFIVQT
jgi:TonB family protein